MPALPSNSTVIDFHLLGQVSYDDCLALQRRLVYEVSSRRTRHAIVLLCEHPDLITVGRAGSRSHIRIDTDTLHREQLAVRWVDRSGGCVLHAPGQLAIYPIVPLDAFGWSSDEYLSRLREALRGTLESLNIPSRTRPNSHDIWGRTGLLATTGVSVRDATTYHGAFLNVAPEMSRYGHIDTAAELAKLDEHATMSCLLAERRLPVRMTAVRTMFIDQLFDAFGCSRHNIHTSHPWLRQQPGTVRESA